MKKIMLAIFFISIFCEAGFKSKPISSDVAQKKIGTKTLSEVHPEMSKMMQGSQRAQQKSEAAIETLNKVNKQNIVRQGFSAAGRGVKNVASHAADIVITTPVSVGKALVQPVKTAKDTWRLIKSPKQEYARIKQGYYQGLEKPDGKAIEGMFSKDKDIIPQHNNVANLAMPLVRAGKGIYDAVRSAKNPQYAVKKAISQAQGSVDLLSSYDVVPKTIGSDGKIAKVVLSLNQPNLNDLAKNTKWYTRLFNQKKLDKALLAQDFIIQKKDLSEDITSHTINLSNPMVETINYADNTKIQRGYLGNVGDKPYREKIFQTITPTKNNEFMTHGYKEGNHVAVLYDSVRHPQNAQMSIYTKGTDGFEDFYLDKDSGVKMRLKGTDDFLPISHFRRVGKEIVSVTDSSGNPVDLNRLDLSKKRSAKQ